MTVGAITGIKTDPQLGSHPLTFRFPPILRLMLYSIGSPPRGHFALKGILGIVLLLAHHLFASFFILFSENTIFIRGAAVQNENS